VYSLCELFKKNHSVNYCWDLHGKPSGLASHQISSQEDISSSSGPSSTPGQALDSDMIAIPRDEYAQFLAYKRAIPPSTATLAQSGTASNCLLSSTHDPWVIDSGATEHMTGSSHTLSDYHPVDSPQSVTLANGSLAKVEGSGNTHLSPDLELLSVFYVPGFPFLNLSSSLSYLFLLLSLYKPGRLIKTVTYQGRTPGTKRFVVQFRRLQKSRSISLSSLVSFHFRRSGTNTSPNSFESRPGFPPLTNYVTTTEQTWLTNIVYAPLM